MRLKPLPSAQTIREVFNYKDGALTWKISPGRNTSAGAKAGTLHHSGYLVVRYKNESYLVHRIIYKYFYGVDPELIDHKDGNSLNNLIGNLRSVSSSGNSKNIGYREDSRSGVSNVTRTSCGNKWQVRVSQKYFGSFDSIEEAKKIRDVALKSEGYYQGHGERLARRRF